MIGIVGFLLRGIPVLAGWFTATFGALSGWLAGLLVLAGVVFFDKIALVVSWAVGWLLSSIVALLVAVLGLVVGLLPDMPTEWPTLGSAWTTLLSGAAIANRYIPITEILTYLSLFAALYGLLGVWKLVKFIRGGG